MATGNNRQTARDIFWRVEECLRRGHEGYSAHAARLEDYYIGAGRQWDRHIRRDVEQQGRPAIELNLCMQAVNAAVGYQIQNRVDMACQPKGGEADEAKAKVLSRVLKHALDNTHYRWHETQAFMDGLIQQRGWLDVRLSYEDNDEGELKITTFDPRDVMPDPDATGYDPDTWADVSILRWLTADEIEQEYGKAARQEIVAQSAQYVDRHWSLDYGTARRGFGDELPPSYAMGSGWLGADNAWRRYRIVDRQSHEYQHTLVAKYPTGDLRIIEGIDAEALTGLIEQGVIVMKRRIRRVRWQVAGPEVTVYDQLSPFEHFTVVPYFPYFRRGKSLGMLDNAVQVQDLLNKFVSQYAHIVNGSANSGWQGEADSLVNMSDQEFVERGAETGLVLLRKPGVPPMTKIEPNSPPSGIEHMIRFLQSNMQAVTAINESALGADNAQMSGVAIQSRQFAAQQALGICLDNLARTRQMLALRCIKLLQKFYAAPRVIRISQTDEYGVSQPQMLELNMPQDDGSVLNDLTIGEYDVQISEQPYAVTFDNSQLEQMARLVKDMGVPIPYPYIVKASTLADKNEISNALRQSEEHSAPADPRIEAQVEKIRADTRKADSEAVNKAIDAQYSAIRTAVQLAHMPQAAALADALLRSGGFVDRDGPPIVPQPAANGSEHAANTPQPAELSAAENYADEPAPNPAIGVDTGQHHGQRVGLHTQFITPPDPLNGRI